MSYGGGIRNGPERDPMAGGGFPHQLGGGQGQESSFARAVKEGALRGQGYNYQAWHKLGDSTYNILK